ncbi:hypothetical protein TWF718_000374 [Orbilia javanica]|uniref:NACHT domain-containing protein n=1 Tax=Orbilia javanica TaxID=47235 RepID=A0AAN8MZ87_9PEZI
MATIKNRGYYRAANIDSGTSEEDFRSELLSRLTEDERTHFTLHLRFAPACTDPETRIAIFKFEPVHSGPPQWLQREDPSFSFQRRIIAVDADFFNLTQLFPVVPSEIMLDIVAISGLNSHAYGSWVGRSIDGVESMWLCDFLGKDENLRHCRTMTFGYDTKYRTKAQNWIEDYVEKFLTEINKARRDEIEQRRPLVLIGHSFGGTIISHAFVRASETGPYESLYASVRAIFFFGVPFGGMRLEDVLSMLEGNDEISGQGCKLVQDIVYETARATNTVTMFKQRIGDTRTPVFSFYETHMTKKVVKLPNGDYGRHGDYALLVDKGSVNLGIPEYQELLPSEADHSTIVKFRDEQDSTYTGVRDRLRHILREVENEAATRSARRNISKQEREMIAQIRKEISSVPGAAFDSYTDDGLDARCHPETRKELLQQIKDWAKSPEDQGKCIFWLNGMAGTGKSTISRTVAQYFEDNGQLGASFFFKRGESDRDNASKFFTTIATQLVQTVPDIIVHVKQNVDAEPEIGTKSLEKQFEGLILHPLGELRLGQSPTTSVFVIDALDECQDEYKVGQVLCLLEKLRKIQAIKIRIFLTSRPELPIRLGFRSMSPNAHQSIILQDLPRATIQHDIEVFLRHKFFEIKSAFNEFSLGDGLPPEWPGNVIIQKLAEMAMPLFIYAATLCRFIEDTIDWNPGQRLATILEFGTIGVSQLERTYLPILKQLESGRSEQELRRSVFGQEFREIVGAIVNLADPLSIVSLASLLGKSKGDIGGKLHRLHSVLSVPQDINLPIRLLHLSFREFLVDPKKKSGDSWFWINENETHSTVFRRCLEVLSTGEGVSYSAFQDTYQGLRENICSLEYPGMPRKEVQEKKIDERIPKHAQYACLYWPYHLEYSGERISDGDIVHSFLKRHFLHWLEALSLLGKISNAGSEGSELSNFLDDARRFVLYNRSIADYAPLQIYSSAIIFSPKSSIVRQTFRNAVPRWIHRFPEAPEFWDARLQTLEGNANYVAAVAFSPDGNQLASGPRHGPITIRDAATGQETGTHDSIRGVLALVFSPDSKQLIVASEETIILNIATGDQVKVDTEGVGDYLESRATRTAAISPDCKYLARLSDSGTIRVWDLLTRKGLISIPDCVVDFLVQYTLVALGLCGNQVVLLEYGGGIIWDVGTGHRIGAFGMRCQLGDFRSAAFSIDLGGRYLACGSGLFQAPRPGLSRGCELQRLGDLGEFLGGEDVNAVAWSPDGKRLALGTDNGRIHILDMEKATPLPNPRIRWRTKADRDPLHKDVVLSPDGERLALRLTDCEVQVWNTKTKEMLGGFNVIGRVRREYGDRPIFFGDCGRLAVELYRGCAHIYDVAKRQKATLPSGEQGSLDAIDVSPGGEQLVQAVASYDQTCVGVSVWHLATGRLQASRQFSREPRLALVALSADGKRVALASSQGRITIWDINTTTRTLDQIQILNLAHTDMNSSATDVAVLRPHKPIKCVAFSPDNQQLASVAASYDPRASSWNISTGQRLLSLWDIPTGQRLRTIYVSGMVTRIRFSDDGGGLQTNMGIVPIYPESPTSVRPGDIFYHGEWITRGDLKLLWLPPEYRGRICDAQMNILVIVWLSGTHRRRGRRRQTRMFDIYEFR